MPVRLSENELTKLGFMVDPDHPDELVQVKDEMPAEDWSLEKLAWYASRAEERARRFAHLESTERFLLGKALHLARQKTQWGEWNAWLDKTFNFSRMTAWRSEQLYLRATDKYGERAEEACGNCTINDLYVRLGIKKQDEWLNTEDGEKNQGAQPR